MNNLELRVYRLELALQQLQAALDALTARVGQLEANQYANTSPGIGGGGGSSQYLVCCPDDTIDGATGCPPTGVPGGPLTGQEIFKVNGGAWVSFATNIDIYNGMTNPVAMSKALVVMPNADGSYTGISQDC